MSVIGLSALALLLGIILILKGDGPIKSPAAALGDRSQGEYIFSQVKRAILGQRRDGGRP